MSTSKLFVSLEGEECSIEEQVVILSQSVRALEAIVKEQNSQIDNLYTRLFFLEAK